MRKDDPYVEIPSGFGLNLESVVAINEKLGYCERCAENTKFRLLDAQLFDRPVAWFTTHFAGGPWYCEQCRVERWSVHRPLKSSAEADERSAGSVSVGNFIRGDSNLVMQSTRSSRYSEKFRASVVQRVLEGKQSLVQIADELDVPQADVLVWVAQQFDQKQQEIDRLKRTLEQLSELTAGQARIETRIDLETAESTRETRFRGSGSASTVEGRVN